MIAAAYTLFLNSERTASCSQPKLGCTLGYTNNIVR